MRVVRETLFEESHRTISNWRFSAVYTRAGNIATKRHLNTAHGRAVPWSSWFHPPMN